MKPTLLEMSLPFCRICRTVCRPLLPALLLLAGLGLATSAAAELSLEAASRHFHRAQADVASRTAQAALRVESETQYTLRFSERPGMRELLTQPVDPTRLAQAPRPPFWWPEARVHWGEYLWDGRVESFDSDRAVSLVDPERYRLARTEPTTARGRDALHLVFESRGLQGASRVTVTVDRATFEPLTVIQELTRPITAYGARLTDYRLTLHLTARGGYWLVAQGEESYSFTTPQGDRQVHHAWKSLSWTKQPEPRRVALRSGTGR